LFFVFSSVPLPASVVERTARAEVADLRPARNIGGAETESGWIFLPKESVPSERR